MEGVPDRVIEFQDMYQARSRVVILRQLLNRPMTFPELRSLVNMSAAALREGINDLEAAGYVTDDAPEHSKRKPSTAVFSVAREKLMTDLSETIRFLTI